MPTNFDPQEFWGWVRARGVDMTCPACGTVDHWNVGARESGIPYATNENLDLSGGYVVVPTWCQHCGYTRFFSLTPYTGIEGDEYTPPTPAPRTD